MDIENFRYNIYAYVGEAFLVLFFKLPAIVAILFSRKSRTQKELVVLFGLMISDCLYSIAFAIGSIKQLMRDDLPSHEFTSRWHCMTLNPVIILGIFAHILIGFMTMAISTERIFAVFYPIVYYKANARYAWSMHFVSCVIATSLTLLAILLVYLNRDFSDVSADCRLTDALPTQFWQALLSLRIFLVLLSVLFYIPIAKRLTGVSKKTHTIYTQTQTPYWQRKRLIHSTTTIGLTLLSSAIMLLIPDTMLLINLGRPELTAFLYNVILAKSLVNYFIHALRSQDLRNALAELCSRVMHRFNVVNAAHSNANIWITIHSPAIS